VAVGQRVPDWAQTAWDDYAKRFPPELKVELKAVKTEPRGSKTLETLYAAERERIEAAIPRGCRVVALDERGTSLTTVALAAKLKAGSWAATTWRWSSAAPTGWTRPFARPRTSASACPT
jgi:23S rRNA (pseudouridine1915-N3)-methyltransferase